MKHKYLIEVFWSEEDGGYIAVAPDLPGCSAFGDTPTEAMREMEDAIESWLEACRNMGRTVPKPKAQPQKAA
ncbi:type II toxin-antitoxin system HicB family antitoxin [Methylohalobius crimeensis]|uniref:type II toxin-antitoxin system HicB family antitoxin n=1 Tax=Methylohalobius crimeensis TaxID=244365 RepID=UPI0003B3C28F|nr:type II toxin-antitoxin system HicB family antitoxin [Methylohalobius crimeensis]